MFFIYVIINTLNNKFYIGKTNNIKRRWQEHLKVSRGTKEKYGKDFRSIHAAIKKYGELNFSINIIEGFEDEKCAFETEKFWIEYFQSRKLGYNETPGGDGLPSGINHPMYGKHHSEETRKKLSIARKGKTPSLGIKASKETIEKIGKRVKGSGNPMYGKHHTEEAKKKISISNSGRINLRKGHKMSDEQKKIIGEKVALAFSKLKGEDRPNAKLTNKQIEEIRLLFSSNQKSPKEIWEMYNISKPTLYRIIRKETYKD